MMSLADEYMCSGKPRMGDACQDCTCTGPARDAHDPRCPVRKRHPRTDLGDAPLGTRSLGDHQHLICLGCGRRGFTGIDLQTTAPPMHDGCGPVVTLSDPMEAEAVFWLWTRVFAAEEIVARCSAFAGEVSELARHVRRR